MIENEAFVELLKLNDIEMATGVPCSAISRLFHTLDSSKLVRYFAAATEGEAIGIASGAWLSGKNTAVFYQNSGIGNTINPLASLSDPYAIPALMFVSMRGAPGFPDEAQHEIMGTRGGDFLKLVNVETQKFPKNTQDLEAAFSYALGKYQNRSSFAFLIDPKTFENSSVISSKNIPGFEERSGHLIVSKGGDDITRYSAIDIVAGRYDDDLIIATMGMTSRELYAISGSRPNHFLMTGSLGHAAPIGFGLAKNVKEPVVVLDGDGALLMKMGVCATIGRYTPKNLVHIVLDNGVYGSTGNHLSSTCNLDFSLVAKAAGYNQIYACEGRQGISNAISAIDDKSGPTFLHCKVSSEEKEKAPRPDMDMKDHALGFREYVIGLK